MGVVFIGTDNKEENEDWEEKEDNILINDKEDLNIYEKILKLVANNDHDHEYDRCNNNSVNVEIKENGKSKPIPIPLSTNK